ncbi:MAG: AmmeMemoRadiSam system protein A [Demequinaceae bacterium]|nr:AmmeMemoRadiSam system protein A [Demequinaceae bacterium]
MPDADRTDEVPDDAGALLLPTARASIEKELGMRAEPPTERPAWALKPGASFVTLTEGGQLRGCIGSLEARRPLLNDVALNAVAAATQDPRFAPLKKDEWEGVSIEVSVLSAPIPFPVSGLADAYARLRPGIDGVIVEMGAWNRATFLPQVWEDLPTPEEFLSHLWHKAGIRPGTWHTDIALETYSVKAWHEER